MNRTDRRHAERKAWQKFVAVGCATALCSAVLGGLLATLQVGQQMGNPLAYMGAFTLSTFTIVFLVLWQLWEKAAPSPTVSDPHNHCAPVRECSLADASVVSGLSSAIGALGGPLSFMCFRSLFERTGLSQAHLAAPEWAGIMGLTVFAGFSVGIAAAATARLRRSAWNTLPTRVTRTVAIASPIGAATVLSCTWGVLLATTSVDVVLAFCCGLLAACTTA